MRGSRAKVLRRAAYGPDSGGEDHRERGYTILHTYQKIVPRLIEAEKDDGTEEEKAGSIQIPGPGGKIFNYRYTPWNYHGQHVADQERRQYLWAKRNWKSTKTVNTSRGW